ncbi:hypothetical protein J7F03_37710 [Streptomyces sp. ISL-43]|uniref:hypothetical protein n=1 Tax=Streptomyces sp. ISL-43 TaxID=2819183 RepID=UPI001BEA7E88|nr:hypothetical protein [Streptomyces sp. ISL-43]MBT2452681.1 hypothetical protein [Streptomyces sp. ISL-43]
MSKGEVRVKPAISDTTGIQLAAANMRDLKDGYSITDAQIYVAYAGDEGEIRQWLAGNRRRAPLMFPREVEYGKRLAQGNAFWGGLKMKLRHFAVGLILLVIGGIAFVVWRTLPGTSEVGKEARGQVVSGVKVMQEIDTTNPAGQPVYEISYIVLDVGVPSGQGVRQQTDRMRSLGWDVDEEGPANFSADNSRLNGVATFTLLRDYLAEPNPGPSEVETAKKLRERFGEGDDLILVILRPLDPSK